MAITATDIHFRASIVTGSAGNQSAFGGAGSSLGKYITNNDIVDATLNNLFTDISGDENAASQIDYQCIFVYNAHGTLAYTSVVVWIASEVAGGASFAIGVDTTAASALASATAQALQIANDNTAPAAVTFSSPTTKAGGLSLGTINAGQVKAFWVRRTAANTAAVDNDGGTFQVSGDTTA